MEKFWEDERSGGKKWRAGAQKRQHFCTQTFTVISNDKAATKYSNIK